MPCGRIGSTELMLIVLLIVVLFGARRLPELGKGLGLGIRGFKKAIKEGEEEKDKPAKHGGSDQDNV